MCVNVLIGLHTKRRFNMKSFAAWLLIVCLALSLCACAAEEPAVVTEAPVTEPVTVPVEESVELVTEEVIEGQLNIGAETNYYVTVMDQDGAPVPGVAVRLDNNKSIPCDTNELGAIHCYKPDMREKMRLEAIKHMIRGKL